MIRYLLHAINWAYAACAAALIAILAALWGLAACWLLCLI